MRTALKRIPLIVKTVRAARRLPGMERMRRVYADLFPERVFTTIYQENQWEDADSRSGEGSSLPATAILRSALPALLGELRVRSMLDIPCGDFHWMQTVDLGSIHYTGADIVSDVIASNTRKYGSEHRIFLTLNAARDPLPPADLVLCRDLLIHLSFAQIWRVIAQVRRSSATWLAASTYTQCPTNLDARTGDCRDINLELEPFHFPAPIVLIDEEPGIGMRGKSLGVWRVCELPLR
jgi:hypothetical protein